MNTLSEIINNAVPEIIRLRQHLHQQAELSWQEVNTTEIIKQQVQQEGYELHPLDGVETGGYVDLVADHSFSFLAFRADMDALPVKDDPQLEYTCQSSEVCHACGHDFHMAVGLAIIKCFRKIQSALKYNLRIIFQPAEEPIPSGALKCLNTSVLEQVSAIFAVHVEPELPVGTVSFAEGWVNAQSHALELTFSGKGGHSARMHQADHLIAEAALFIQQAIDFIQVKNLPDQPAILAFTGIEAGREYNILPEKVNLKGTLRVTRPETFTEFQGFAENFSKKLKKTSGITLLIQWASGAPPVIISSEVFRKIKNIFSQPGNTKLELANYRSLGGDDFGWYLTKLPGALIRIGVRDSWHKTGLHQPGFNANDRALEHAMNFILTLYMRWT